LLLSAANGGVRQLCIADGATNYLKTDAIVVASYAKADDHGLWLCKGNRKGDHVLPGQAAPLVAVIDSLLGGGPFLTSGPTEGNE
jgi:hypothetical protein